MSQGITVSPATEVGKRGIRVVAFPWDVDLTICHPRQYASNHPHEGVHLSPMGDHTLCQVQN